MSNTSKEVLHDAVVKLNTDKDKTPTQNLHEAATALKKRIITGDLAFTCMGMCHGLESVMQRNNVCFADRVAVRCVLSDLWKQWPKYSGHSQFPVPSANPEITAEMAFFYANMRMWVDDYGKLRLELLDFLIERTKP